MCLNVLALVPTLVPKSHGLFKQPDASQFFSGVELMRAIGRLEALAPMCTNTVELDCINHDAKRAAKFKASIMVMTAVKAKEDLYKNQIASMMAQGGVQPSWFSATPTHAHFHLSNTELVDALAFRLSVSYPRFDQRSTRSSFCTCGALAFSDVLGLIFFFWEKS